MAKNIIQKENVKYYYPILWQGRPVWKYFAQLKNHLSQSLGPEYANLFAEPLISESAAGGLSDTVWLSENLSKSASPISALSSDKLEKYEAILSNRIRTIENHANELISSNDSIEREWGDLILKCLEIPSYNFVFAEAEEVLIVMWGFKMRNQTEAFSLSKKIATLPIVETAENDLADISEEELKKEIESEPILLTDEELKEEQFEDKKNELQISKSPQIEPEPNINEVNNTEDVDKKTDTNQITEDKKIIYVPTGPNWKNLLWILLLIALLILLLLLLGRTCKGVNSILPEKPNVLVPIDTTKIKSDEDSTSIIVSDRLNLAIGAKDKTVKDFAKAFKKMYTSGNYKIIYYDDKTKRIQLQIPETEREKLKKELKEKFADYKLLVWDESLFKSGSKPSDPGFSNVKQSWHHERVSVYNAWGLTMGNNDLVIAIIDDGFDLSHPELSKNIVKPRNLCNPTARVNAGKTGHGTHVAALALGLANNGFGLSGIAPNCKFMPLQVADGNGIMTSTAIIDAVLYAINNDADVINMSLGKLLEPKIANMPESGQEEMAKNLFVDEEEFWNQLFGMAAERGITVVLAGGNQNVIIGIDPMQRTPHTINISAINPSNNKADFSNYGRRSSLSAPGVQIYSAIPGGKIAPMDGTSMAAPIVTGAVALMKSVNPTYTNQQILTVFQKTGIKMPLKNGYIGNLIQIDAALGLAQKNRAEQPNVECEDKQAEIDALLRKIEFLKEKCSYNNNDDTLRFSDKKKMSQSLLGRWKSTTDLVLEGTNDAVEIYFDFEKNNNGTVDYLVKNAVHCSTFIDYNISDKLLSINQNNQANCNNYKVPGVSANVFVCKEDKNGHALCEARANNKIVKFKLIKIK